MSLTVYDGQPPFFSVILCTFNRAYLLPRALDSLLAQEETSWEAIVVDDGSTDDTYAVVRRYFARMPNLRYLFHHNRGLRLSRNVGIGAAAGDFVTFLDSDDFYTPDHLAVRRRLLAEHPDVELLHGGCEIIGNPLVPDKDDPTQMLDLHDLPVGGTFVMPRGLAVAIGGFPDTPYSIDGELFERFVAEGRRIVKTDAPTYVYDRTTPDSLCHIVADGGVDAILEYRRKGSWHSERGKLSATTGQW